MIVLSFEEEIFRYLIVFPIHHEFFYCLKDLLLLAFSLPFPENPNPQHGGSNMLPCLEDWRALAPDDPDPLAFKLSVIAKLALRSNCMLAHD